MLSMDVEIRLGDGVWIELFIIGTSALVFNAAVDHEMRNVNALRSKFPR